ncbi:MAG: WbqC family protein [Lentisphaerae bacterium]|nr:WbqC family protein [Lentisphaerota bacterium]
MQEKRVIGIVQPTYLPWMPFFERMAISDRFVLLDDVEYSKNSFHNRNALKSPNGRIMLTVPVLYKGYSKVFINEIYVDNTKPWQRKHWNTIRQCYAKAPYFDTYKDELESMYMAPKEKLINVIIPLIDFLKRELGIATPCRLSSEIGVTGNRNEKLVGLCKHFQGTHFVVKPNTHDYHPAEEFEPHGIRFHYLEYSKVEYPQLHGKFEPYLSALDFVMNCGPGVFASYYGKRAIGPRS